MKRSSLKSNKTSALAAALLTFFLVNTTFPQTDAEVKALAKQSQNPLANMISLPLQFNFNFGLGEYDRTQMVVNVQPVISVDMLRNANE